MHTNQIKLALSGALLLGLPLAYSSVYAAKAVNLNHQKNVSILQSFISSPTAAAMTGTVNLKETGRTVGFNKMLHVRIQQTYSGHPIWGANAIVHIPNGESTAKSFNSVMTAAKTSNSFMNGTLYQDIQADLASTPASTFTSAHAQEMVQHAVKLYQNISGKAQVKDPQSDLIVYIDKNNKAHWAYKISFLAPSVKGNKPALPVFVIDAVSKQVYEQWDDIKTIDVKDLETTVGGGYGGNPKLGRLTYDGLDGDLPVLNIKRNASKNLCYLQNEDVKVKKCTMFNMFFGCVSSEDFTTACKSKDANHNNVYWNGDSDTVNGGYSPSNDALFNGAVIKDMYQKWYNVPVLVNEDGKTPLLLTMVVHLEKFDNAFWDPRQQTMNFGDGESMFYPLTSLDVASHEISHGFTEQHAGLVYEKESGGMNEAYSDMVTQAAQIYAYGRNNWQIGPEIFKEDRALRYMDDPSKDCGSDDVPGESCSLSSKDQYDQYVAQHAGSGWPDSAYPNVHYTSGIYNKAFYLIASQQGWNDVRKAFQVMLDANMNYWTPNAGFSEIACGVVKATEDRNKEDPSYRVDVVKKAFAAVGIETNDC